MPFAHPPVSGWPRGLRALGLATAVAVSGCGTVAPSSSPASASSAPQSTAPASTAAGPTASPRSAADVYAAIREQVIQIRGLTPTKPVDPVSLDETELRANLTADFDRENTPAELQLGQDELITLGLLPKDA